MPVTFFGLAWIKVAIYAAIAAVLVGAVLAIKAHWVNQGEANIQKRWDADTIAGMQLSLQISEKFRQEAERRRRNSERNANENHRLAQVRAERLAALDADLQRLHDATEALDAMDVSSAAGDARAAAIARSAIAARKLLGSCTAKYRELADGAEKVRIAAIGLQADALTVCRGGAPAGAAP